MKKMKQMNFKLTDSDLNLIEKASKKERLSMSTFIRKIILDYIEINHGELYKTTVEGVKNVNDKPTSK